MSIHNLVKMTSTRLLQLKEECQGLTWHLMPLHFLLLVRREEGRHSPETYDLTGPLRSEGGTLLKVISAVRAATFASLSATTFLCIPT